MKHPRPKILFVLTGLGLFLSGCTEDAPTKQDDDPIAQDTIPVSMTQEHIPWESLADSPWPMYSHDPQGTKRSQHAGPVSGEIEWSKWTDGVKKTYGFTAFSIGPDSSIYYGSTYEKPPGSSQTWVFYAIDKNGATKWTFRDTIEYTAEIITAPIITSNDEIIFATPLNRSHLNIYKLDFSGELIWKSRYEAAQYIPDNLNIGLDGTIYFIDGGQNLAAVNPDGSLKWVKMKDETFMPNATWALAISPDGNTLYIPGARYFSELYAVGLDGETKWDYNIPDSIGYVYSQPMVDNQGNIYFSVSQAGIYSLNPDGSLRWTFPQSTSIDAYTIGNEGHIYFCDGDELIALGYNGEELWRQQLDTYQYSPILIDNSNTIFLPGRHFKAINSTDGSLLWTIELPTAGWQGAAIGYDNLLVYGYADYDSVKNVIGIR